MWSSSVTSHSSNSSKSSKSANDNSLSDNSAKELSSDDEEDNTPTPVNESNDENDWNGATEPLDFTTTKLQSHIQSVEDKARNCKRTIGPQLVSQSPPPVPSHQCCRCAPTSAHSYDDCLSTSRLMEMTETANRMPAMVAKRNFHMCDHCGITCAHMFLEPIASSYWDHVVPHHHSIHQNFHYRKVQLL